MTGDTHQIRGTDCLIAIGLGLEWTQEATAEFAGCTDRTVRNRKDVESVQWLAAKISSAVARGQRDFERKTREHYEGLLESYLEEATRKAVGGSLRSGELKDQQWAFDRVADRVLGKPTQRTEVSGSMDHNHRVVAIPPELFAGYIEAKREALGLPPKTEVVEGEVMSDDFGSDQEQ